jgi:hypothetical protein
MPFGMISVEMYFWEEVLNHSVGGCSSVVNTYQPIFQNGRFSPTGSGGQFQFICTTFNICFSHTVHFSGAED